MQVTGTQIPSKGDRVEQHRTGVIRHGHVWYADQLQVLVKWEDGKSAAYAWVVTTLATPRPAAPSEEDVSEAAPPRAPAASVS